MGAAITKTRDTAIAKTAQIIVGPFDLKRRYKSMEGPYVQKEFKIGDLLAARTTVIPESAITFVGSTPDLPNCLNPKAADSRTSAAAEGSKQRELYWFKGMKIDVLDESDKLLPDAEFICHMNVDVDAAFRDKAFARAERCHNQRLITLTQGQTEIVFPDGFAVPVATDETWTLQFQAANRTTDAHRRVKHRLTVAFIKDSDLVYPVKALAWYAPYIGVVVDHDSPEAKEAEHKNMPNCLGMSYGVNAPHTSPGMLETDPWQRELSGHWVVPPGKHSYSSPLTDLYGNGFVADKDRLVHLVWSHVHPLCTSMSLIQCGKDRRPLWTVNCKTDVSKGLQMEKIETISSEQGILLPRGAHFELNAVYDNTTKVAHDSMAVSGIFFEDNSFVRPKWHVMNQVASYYGLKENSAPNQIQGGLQGTNPMRPAASAMSSTQASAQPIPASAPGASNNKVTVSPEEQQEIFKRFVDAYKFALTQNSPQEHGALLSGMRISLVKEQAGGRAICSGPDDIVIAVKSNDESANEFSGVLGREATHAQHLRMGGPVPAYLEEGTACDVGMTYQLRLGADDAADRRKIAQRAKSLSRVSVVDARRVLGSTGDSVALDGEVGELFVEFLRNRFNERGFPDAVKRIGLIVRQMPKEMKRTDPKWQAAFDTAFKSEFGLTSKEANDSFIAYIEQTKGSARLRLNKTKYERFL